MNTLDTIIIDNNKQDGDTLNASEWNTAASAITANRSKINEIINGGTGGNSPLTTEADQQDSNKTYVKINNVPVGELTSKGDKGTNVCISSNNNVNIEPRAAVGTGAGKNTPGIANRKGGNISLKPGDDIELCSHKRGTGKNTEVAVKVLDGSENPVKLQIVAGEITLSTKGKGDTKQKNSSGEDTDQPLYDNSNVMDVNVTTGEGKGYLKVRAQAIDLRCEEHGGIALQPKGTDNSGKMNKIKFEHGGGDGLEFGTFNTEKTSIFTNEYRFNRDGKWKMATRQKEVSDKYKTGDETTHYKYVKQADDFYDVISKDDEVCTTKDIIKTAYALNGAKDRHAKITNEGAIEIATNATYVVQTVHASSTTGNGVYGSFELGTWYDFFNYSHDPLITNSNKTYKIWFDDKTKITGDFTARMTCYTTYSSSSVPPSNTIIEGFNNKAITIQPESEGTGAVYTFSASDVESLAGVVKMIRIEMGPSPTSEFSNDINCIIREVGVDVTGAVDINTIAKYPSEFEFINGRAYNAKDFNSNALPVEGTVYTDGTYFCIFNFVPAPSIKIDSDAELKLGGILDFGSTFNFGETDKGIEVQNKYTKNGNIKDCGKLKVIAVNNNSSAHTFNTLWDPTANNNAGASIAETTTSVAAGQSVQIAEASIYDIIKLTNYMKSNNLGPWTTTS